MDGFSASAVSSSNKSYKRRRVGLCEWRDWPNLPEELLLDIAHRLADPKDHIQFGQVCVSWRRTFLAYKKAIGSPLLLIAPPGRPDQRDVYSPSTINICSLQIQLPHSKICRGSSFGWLIIFEVKDLDVYHVQLRNLFLNITINLPPLDNIVQLQADEPGIIELEYIWKAVLSSDPLVSGDYIVMGLIGRFCRLAFFKPGSKLWTPVGEHRITRTRPKESFKDVIFYRKAKQFYALTHTGRVLAVKFQGDQGKPKLRQVAPALASPPANGNDSIYLVEDFSTGDLLQVRKRLERTEKDKNGKSHVLTQFLIFKFEPSLKHKWNRVHDLRNKVLFLGSTSSVLRSASDCPGCVPNCIYYVTDPQQALYNPDKYYEHLSDGIYNLEDGTIQQLHPSLSMNISSLSMSTRRRLNSTIWLDPAWSKQPS